MSIKVALEKLLREESRDAKIPCRKALLLAEKLSVNPSEVGKAADRLKIKIVACQLGCFK